MQDESNTTVPVVPVNTTVRASFDYDYVSFVGNTTLPFTERIGKRVWDVRVTAFGAYRKVGPVVNNCSWYEHITKSEIGLWFCATNNAWVIGWAADRLNADPPVGWILKEDSWMVATQESFVNVSDAKLMGCTTLNNIPVVVEKGDIVKKRVKTRMESVFDRFINGNCSAEEFERLRNEYHEEESMSVDARFSELKRKLDDYHENVRETKRLYTEARKCLEEFH
jgi:hypothetical protein